MEASSPAQQRAFAVARLKRAASLPRMQNGRRPKMHTEAVSEGEKTAAATPESVTPEPEPADPIVSEETPREMLVPTPFETALVEPPTPTQADPPDEAPPLSTKTPEPPPDPEAETEAEMTPQKKRRRSRSRSRGSRDLRKLRGAASPPVPSAPATPAPAGDSSPDEFGGGAGLGTGLSTAPFVPPVNAAPFVPPVLAPVPSHYAQFQAERLLMTPEPGFFYGSSAALPGLPSLEAIQRGALARGLQRSNSAAARIMAFNRLANLNTDLGPVPAPPSPSGAAPMSALPLGGARAGALGAALGRNNTVTGAGEERTAARRMLLRRLNERIEKADGPMSGGEEPRSGATTPLPLGRVPAQAPLGSSGEDDVPPPEVPTPRRRKRRSRGAAAARTDVVDDRELSSTAAETSVPPTPSVMTGMGLPDPLPTAPSPGPRGAQLERANTLAKLLGKAVPEQPSTPRTRRSVVIEEDDDAGPAVAPAVSAWSPATPLAGPSFAGMNHLPQASTDSGVGVPVYLEETMMYAEGAFPSSISSMGTFRPVPSVDEDEEVLFAPPRPWQSEVPRDVSWVDEPLLRRMPVNDDDEDEEEGEEDEEQTPAAEVEQHEEAPLSAVPSEDYSAEHDPSSHRVSDASDSKEVSSDKEPGEDVSYEDSSAVLSPDQDAQELMRVSALSSTLAVEGTRSSEDAQLQHFAPLRLSEALSQSTMDDAPFAGPQLERSTSKSRWEKVKHTFSRSNSRSGHRSRSNSVTAREHTLSSASRESGASLGSGRAERDGGTFARQQATPPPLSPSASTTVLGHPPPGTPMSPMPSASTADLMRYGNAKLFPFPGIMRLEEERNRSKNALAVATSLSASASSPDIASSDGSTSVAPSTWSAATSRQREPKQSLTHQQSDTGLFARFQSPAQLSAATSQSSQMEYIDVSQPSGTLSHSSSTHNMKQTPDKGGVKRWLSASSKKLFSPVSRPETPNGPSSFTPAEVRQDPTKKPSLSDLLKGRRPDDVAASWELAEPSPISAATAKGPTIARPLRLMDATSDSSFSREMSPAPEQPRPKQAMTPLRSPFLADTPNSIPSPPERPSYSSATPDPLSSLDDYPTRGSSASSSTLSSRLSDVAEPSAPIQPARGPEVLQRLDEMLGRGSRSPMWTSAVEDPPRKLVLSSPVLQVVNSNTVKDRFLFMFSDMLVIAKPIIQDHDLLMETKPSPLDRKFVVKNVVRLHELRISADRDDPPIKMFAMGPSRSPALRDFVDGFAVDSDRAISDLFAKARSRDDPVALGQLLYHSADISRGALGEYLLRRSSRVVLKAYIDGFGLTGLRIDNAMRALLISLGVPARSSAANPIENLVDALATRWYEANAGSVPYDKDLAIRLARAILQLNEVMHGAIADEPGHTPYPRRNVTARDFIAAFRKYDVRGLVSDELLDQIYTSIRFERLVHGRVLRGDEVESVITIKRAVPPRLTYRVQSEPIILRLPSPDPNLRIELFGPGLVFEPQVLEFIRSPEASFRVMGTSLGPKTITMLRAGPNAIAYGGLPTTHALVVERAFMRNTFQLAFLDHSDIKRKYMFSVDDPLLRHQWIVSLRRQTELATTNGTADGAGSGPSAFHRAAETVAVKALQQTLIGSAASPERTLTNMTSVDAALQRVAAASSREQAASGNALSAHNRSKSRSKVYHRLGAGRLEPSVAGTDSPGSARAGAQTADETPPADERAPKVWSGRDVETLCAQNSSIALVLSYLQVGSPDHESFRWSAALK